MRDQRIDILALGRRKNLADRGSRHPRPDVASRRRRTAATAPLPRMLVSTQPRLRMMPSSIPTTWTGSARSRPGERSIRIVVTTESAARQSESGDEAAGRIAQPDRLAMHRVLAAEHAVEVLVMPLELLLGQPSVRDHVLKVEEIPVGPTVGLPLSYLIERVQRRRARSGVSTVNEGYRSCCAG